jgi:hypothetical protein
VALSPLNDIKVTEEVAIMPTYAKSPADVLRISRVSHVGHAFIMASDGRIYMRHDGSDFNAPASRYIQPATEEHRRAIRGRAMI